MKETLAEFEQWGADVIFGRAKGFRASVTRIAMSALSVLFRGVVHARMAISRKRWKQQAHLGNWVISGKLEDLELRWSCATLRQSKFPEVDSGRIERQKICR